MNEAGEEHIFLRNVRDCVQEAQGIVVMHEWRNYDSWYDLV